MSRTLYEYLEARDKWRAEHALRITSFPYPNKESIVYQRESTNPFWERRREYAANLLAPTTLNFSIDDTFKFIKDVASIEQQKEEEFLAKFYPEGLSSRDLNNIDKFNTLFQSRERYDRLLKRIETVKNRWKDDKKKYLAPNMDALYASYLSTRMNKVLSDFRASFTLNTPIETLKENFKTAVEQAMILTINDVAEVQTEDEIYGSGQDWKEIARIINDPNDTYLKDEFVKNIRNAIGNTNIDNVLKTLIEQKQQKTNKNKVSTIIKKNLNLNERTAAIGGNVMENTAAALAQELSKIRGSNHNIQYYMSATAVHGQMAVTDTLFMFSATQDVKQIVRDLNETLSNATDNLDNAKKAIEQFYIDQKEKMDDIYTVFINSKNYQQGGQFGTYTQTKRGSLSQLEDFLTSANVNVSNMQDFLLAAYNTAKGAIYASKSHIQESAINALKAAAVNFMFDDWKMVGSNDNHNIHVFLLSGKYVPSSVVFNAIAEAGEKSVHTTAKIIIPEIKDISNDEYNGNSDQNIKNAIQQHWEDEAKRISEEAKWTASFVINIKEAINLKIH